MIIKRAGLFIEEDERRRGEHGGVAGKHRLGEAEAGGAAIGDERDEALDIALAGGPAVGVCEEAAHEAIGVLIGIGRVDVDHGFAKGLDALAAVAASLAALGGV